MESFFIPTLLVALAEIGDKTQLLALLLATRFRKPVPIIIGIAVATLANHLAAGAIGNWISGFFSEAVLSWIVAASFLLMAAWTLIPDKIDEEKTRFAAFGPFLTTVIAFFLAEMGDKTQVATVILAAQYPHFLLVVMGTTVGMLLANVPVVLVGHFAAQRLPMKLIHRLTAAAFAVLGLFVAWHALKVSGLVQGM